MFHHMLIGYDGSANAKKALEYGIELATLASLRDASASVHTQADMTIVTAFPKVPGYLGSPRYDELVTHYTTEANGLAQMAAEQVRACGIVGERVRVEVMEGSPAECILAVAETRGCDCIVVGSRGLGEMSGLLLGSVSSKLAHYAKVPVLIVK